MIVMYLIFTVFTCTESARILGVFPTPSISHQVVFRSLTLELARRGHELVVITTDPVFPNQTPENFTEIDVHDISYAKWNEALKQMGEHSYDLVQQLDFMLHVLTSIFEKQVKTKDVQKLLALNNDHFDLILAESCTRFALGYSYIFKAPVILISSFTSMFDNHYIMGSPTHPILYPNVMRRRIYNLSMWEKLNELIIELRLQLLWRKTQLNDDRTLKRTFGPEIPPLAELYNNVDMLFLNIHPIWENNRPVPPGVVFMGGIHQKPQKELPKDLKTYLDSSKNGVIYFSLGTNVKTHSLHPEKLRILTKVLSKVQHDVLWKWDDDVLPGRSENIKISKWLPQSDLLRHPKIKLFITQGGLQSTDEAITAGVPLIGIPMLGDQWYNVEQYVKYKVGIKLDIETLSENEFENAINTILNDTSYRENVVKLRSIMRDEPQTALQRGVWWVEHVLRHGGAGHLRAPAANMPWTEYLQLELVLTLTIILLLTLTTLYVIVKRILNIIVLYTFKIKTA